MLRVSKRAALALEVVLDVAYNAGPEPVPVPSRDITRRQRVPNRHLEQILQRLVREEVLRSLRGPRGGYVLARERRRVTLGDVIRVVAELDAEDDAPAASGSDLGEKVLGPLWEDVQVTVLERFDTLTMEDLCQEARALGIPRAVSRVPDFPI